MFNFFEELPKCFPKLLHHFTFLHMLINNCYSSIAILVGVKWYLVVVLICISLLNNGVEHLFMALFGCICPLEKCLFNDIAHFNWLVWIFLLFSSYKCYLFMLSTSSSLDMRLKNILSHSLEWLFTFFSFNLTIVDLQYCASFRCTASDSFSL